MKQDQVVKKRLRFICYFGLNVRQYFFWQGTFCIRYSSWRRRECCCYTDFYRELWVVCSLLKCLVSLQDVWRQVQREENKGNKLHKCKIHDLLCWFYFIFQFEKEEVSRIETCFFGFMISHNICPAWKEPHESFQTGVVLFTVYLLRGLFGAGKRAVML